jgi:hypothetical protein
VGVRRLVIEPTVARSSHVVEVHHGALVLETGQHDGGVERRESTASVAVGR